MAINIAYTGPANETLVTHTTETWAETEPLIDELRAVLHDAYMGELVESQQLLGTRTLDRYFDPADNSLRTQFAECTADLHERGARITYLASIDGEQLLGFSKIGPAPQMTGDESQPRGYAYDGYYLNNIAVRPRAMLRAGGRTINTQNRGWASMLIHANVVANHQYDLSQPLVLDAINGNDRVNSWYQRWGMIPDLATPTGSVGFGDVSIKETYHVTPPDVLLNGVLQYLVARRPWLGSATLI